MNLKPFRKVLVGCAAALTAAGIAFGGMTSASADPINPTGPRVLNGGGSDTSQDVMNGAADNVFQGTSKYLASWNATGTSSITINGKVVKRPNGSSNGLRALSASVNEGGTWTWDGQNIEGTLQFARSSSGPSVAGSKLTFVPYARDAVSYATAATSVVPNGIPLNHTGATDLSLKRIFTCAPGSFKLGNDWYHTTSSTQTGSTLLKPIQLQAGSGTRSFWEGTVGAGSCVLGNAQEHNGQDIAADPAALAPFSVSQWLAQSKVTGKANPSSQANEKGTLAGVEVYDRRYNVKLNSVGIGAPASPTTGTGTAAVQNPSFVTDLTRNVYNVIPTAAIGSSVGTNAALNTAFVSKNSSAIAEAQACKAKSGTQFISELFGFSRTLKQDVPGATLYCGITGVASLQSGWYATS